MISSLDLEKDSNISFSLPNDSTSITKKCPTPSVQLTFWRPPPFFACSMLKNKKLVSCKWTMSLYKAHCFDEMLGVCCDNAFFGDTRVQVESFGEEKLMLVPFSRFSTKIP